MGFDFIMRRLPAGPIAGYTPEDPAAPWYFQMTNIGMAEMHDCMERAGVLDPDCPPPDFPWPPDDIARERADELCAWCFNEIAPRCVPLPQELPRFEPIRKAIEGVQRSRSPRPDLVPSYKFHSNDGWLVVPEECIVIAFGLRAALARVGPDMLPRAFKYMSEAEVAAWVLSWATYNKV